MEHMCVVTGTSTVVKGLKEGKKYKCRVSAVNVYGRSEPLEGDAITAKNPFGKSSTLSTDALTGGRNGWRLYDIYFCLGVVDRRVLSFTSQMCIESKRCFNTDNEISDIYAVNVANQLFFAFF